MTSKHMNVMKPLYAVMRLTVLGSYGGVVWNGLTLHFSPADHVPFLQFLPFHGCSLHVTSA